MRKAWKETGGKEANSGADLAMAEAQQLCYAMSQSRYIDLSCWSQTHGKKRNQGLLPARREGLSCLLLPPSLQLWAAITQLAAPTVPSFPSAVSPSAQPAHKSKNSSSFPGLSFSCASPSLGDLLLREGKSYFAGMLYFLCCMKSNCGGEGECKHKKTCTLPARPMSLSHKVMDPF